MGEIFNPVRVSINQFYGIEINDFAVSVAKTALWIAQSQMLKATEDIVGATLEFFPLKTYTHIVEGNALRMEWGEVVPAQKLNYIMGNPPFVGTKYQSPTQKADILAIDPSLKPLDYVTGWFKKAANLIKNTSIRCAFVATNSITQGEQVAPLWKGLSVSIEFAYRTFRWDSEANSKAHVHCVIVGFADKSISTEKYLFENDKVSKVDHINGYLMAGPDILIESRKFPISKNIPRIIKGSQPTDGGYLLLSQDEKDAFVRQYPTYSPYIKRYMGANDLLNNIQRYCLWLVECPVHLMHQNPFIIQRLEGVKKSRLESPKASTQKWADMPYLFTENRQPDTDYIMLPVVSSERRKYMPISYMSKEVIANANAQMIPNGSLYTFGVLMSSLHNAWVHTVCGRMKSDLAYSGTLVYNNFPWPTPTVAQQQKIERTAQAILDARALYPTSSLADLYDDLTMPVELRKAHQENDQAVLSAYGLPKNITERDIVAHLFQLYQHLTQGK